MVKVTDLKIKVSSLDALDSVLKKVDSLNKASESDPTSNHMNVSVEVDLMENPPEKDEVPPIHKIRMALSEALQNAANHLCFVPEDSWGGKHYDYSESGRKYTDRPEQESTPYSKCSCKYAVRPGDKSIPRPH